MKRLHHAGAGGDRDAEQEGEARRRGAVAPPRSAVVIVMPERDVPGINARA